MDFWRVLIADKREKRLLLFAEMKLPGEAWLDDKKYCQVTKKTLKGGFRLTSFKGYE